MLKYLTTGQRSFLVKVKIKEGGLYMFPRYGFNAYEKPEYRTGEWLDTNPFTNSLDGEMFLVTEITDNGFVKGNFASGGRGRDFYMLINELETRGLLTMIILTVLLYIPFVLYNYFTKS